MYFYRTFLLLIALTTIFLSACQNHSKNQEKVNYSKLTRKDTTDIIQSVLKHKRLDSLLNFAFKDQTLKIVTNNVIKCSLKVVMNNKPVEFTQVDSSSSKLRFWNKPTFYAKITILHKITSGARLVIFFESIGLFGEYELQKNQSNVWEIVDVHFSHT